MKKFIPIILLFVTFSCGPDFSGGYYKCPIELTGGFHEFALDLKSNGNLELSMELSKTGYSSEAGTLFESSTKTVSGNWSIRNKQIYCTFNEPKSSIDSFFDSSDFNSVFIGKQIVTFSNKLDTAIIYGVPCILTDCVTTRLHTTNQDNDTLKVKFIQGVVFDTTAILVHGFVIDQVTRNSISDVSVTLQHGEIQYITMTDSIGEFKFFQNLTSGPWSIKLTHPIYKCLIVNNVVQTGGQWISFRMTQD